MIDDLLNLVIDNLNTAGFKCRISIPADGIRWIYIHKYVGDNDEYYGRYINNNGYTYVGRIIYCIDENCLSFRNTEFHFTDFNINNIIESVNTEFNNSINDVF